MSYLMARHQTADGGDNLHGLEDNFKYNRTRVLDNRKEVVLLHQIVSRLWLKFLHRKRLSC